MLVSKSVFSQGLINVYGGIGYNISTARIDALDYIISRYNETRPWLSEKMQTPSNLSGLSFSLGFYTSSILVDLEYVYKYSSTITAEGSSGDITQRRDLKVYGKSFNVGLNYIIGNSELLIMPGLSFDWNFMPVESRIYNVNNTDPPAYEILSEDGGTSFSNSALMISPNVHIDYSLSERLYISLKPYYSIGVTEIDYSVLNKNLNPNTYENDPADKTSSKFSNFGILFKLKYLLLE